MSAFDHCGHSTVRSTSRPIEVGDMLRFLADGYTAGAMGLSLYEGCLRNDKTKLSAANVHDIVTQCQSLEKAIRTECKVTAGALRQTTVELLAGTTNARLSLLLERFRTSFCAELAGREMLILSEAEQAALTAPRAPVALITPAHVPDEGTRNKGGRPSGKAGEPISRITMRLMKLSREELLTQTASALALDLISEYARLNLLPPSPSNAEREAAGILRAVRK
jgi:hypothetical protein